MNMKPKAKAVNYKINLFHPYVPKDAINAVAKTLSSRWIGQGPKVAEFERRLQPIVGSQNVLAVNSATSALELVYHMMNLGPGDEVISPVYNCTAGNIPLARRGVKVVFADVKDDLMLDWNDAKKRINAKTKAIINVHMSNGPNEIRDLGVPVINDSANYLGKTTGGLFTVYSFQATKLLVTVDGGLLVCRNKTDYKRAKLLRWYGIDRESGKNNIDADIFEAGYKYHMNDVTASIGLASLNKLKAIKQHRNALQRRYKRHLGGIGGSPYLVHVKDRTKLVKELAKAGVETGLVHKRNDIYSVFGGKKLKLPNMNRLEDIYLFLPCHNRMTIKDADFIAEIVKAYV